MNTNPKKTCYILCGMKTACFAVLFSSALMAQPPDVVAGKRTYDEVCQSCHGGNATGGRGPALASTRLDIERIIRAGVAGTEMPPFPALTADQVRQLVA